MKPTVRRTRSFSYRLSLLLSLLMLSAVTAGACTFEVQPIEEFTTADGYLSLTFPAAWDVLEEDSGIEEGSGDGTTAVLISTHPDLVNQDVIPSGEAGVAVVLMPDFIPGPSGETVPLTPEELVVLMHDSALAEQTVVSDVQLMTLANGAEAYTFFAPSHEADMTLHILSPMEKTIAVVAFITAPGEADADLLADAKEILESVQVSGDPIEFGERARVLLGIDQ